MRTQAIVTGFVLLFTLGAARTLVAAPPERAQLLRPSEAARVARVENGLSPVVVKGKPVTLGLERWMELLAIPGLSVAVIDNFEVVWAKGYGVRHTGTREPVDVETLFQAGSISKPVAALAFLHQVEAGKLSLDGNVNDKLRAWKIPDNEYTREQKVTLRRLISHSAGTTVHGFPGYASDEPVPTITQILDGQKPANTGPVRVAFVPGSRFSYSGGGITIAQLLLTEQMSQPFPKILSRLVFGPLHLTHSTYEQPLPAERAADAASGHRVEGRVIAGRWHTYPEMAAAGLWTTPSDLARIAIEVARSKAGKANHVLSPRMTRLMLTRQASDADSTIGLGFFIDPKSDRFGHDGSDEGFRADLIAFSDSGKGIAMMSNSDVSPLLFDRLAESVASEYGWAASEPVKPHVMADVLAIAAMNHQSGIEPILAAYRARRAERPADASAADLNGFAFILSDAGRRADAIRVLEANVALYPKDAGAHASLGDAYVKAGRRADAVASYRRSLALDPTGSEAIMMLRQLGAR